MLKRTFLVKKLHESQDRDYICQSLEIGFKKNELGDFKVQLVENDMILTIYCDQNYQFVFNDDCTFGFSDKAIEHHLNRVVSKSTKQRYTVTEI